MTKIPRGGSGRQGVSRCWITWPEAPGFRGLVLLRAEPVWKVHLLGSPQRFDSSTLHMLYDGPLYTFWDPMDPDKSVVFGTSLDDEDQLYVAFHVDGKVVLRNAVFGKRYGGGAKDESLGKKDKRTFTYLTRQSALELYDLLGGILQGESARDCPSGEDMEGYGVSVDDMLQALEDDK